MLPIKRIFTPHLVRPLRYLQEQVVRGCAPIARISSAPIIIILQMACVHISPFHGLKGWNNAGIRRAVAWEIRSRDNSIRVAQCSGALAPAPTPLMLCCCAVGA